MFGRQLSGHSRAANSLCVECAEVAINDLVLYEPDSGVQGMSKEDEVLERAVVPLIWGHGLPQLVLPHGPALHGSGKRSVRKSK